MQSFQRCSFSIQMKLRLQNGFVHFQTRDVEEVEPRRGGVCVEIYFFLISMKIHFNEKEKGGNDRKRHVFTSFDETAHDFGVVRISTTRYTARIRYIVVQLHHKLRRHLATSRSLPFEVTSNTENLK